MDSEILSDKLDSLDDMWIANRRQLLLTGAPGIMLITFGLISLTLANIIPTVVGILVTVIASLWISMSAGYAIAEPNVRFTLRQVIGTVTIFLGIALGCGVAFAGLGLRVFTFLTTLFLAIVLLIRHGYRINVQS